MRGEFNNAIPGREQNPLLLTFKLCKNPKDRGISCNERSTQHKLDNRDIGYKKLDERKDNEEASNSEGRGEAYNENEYRQALTEILYTEPKSMDAA
ncbi:9780_t:CDS:2 [Acaulospora colombiana]|uniref:9780_t:CDS:1 n=1 Tax=Acaulospora colombiana TaxID=27376 RepID=A0ACA9K3I3_9GLOM|nr:9780_t:CDS:2 [Acaulospora colombiana]